MKLGISQQCGLAAQKAWAPPKEEWPACQGSQSKDDFTTVPAQVRLEEAELCPGFDGFKVLLSSDTFTLDYLKATFQKQVVKATFIKDLKCLKESTGMYRAGISTPSIPGSHYINIMDDPIEHLQRSEATGSENCLEQKLRTPRRRCQQPKMLNSPEDNMYYNQLNGTLEYQGSKRKPRKLGQIKVLDGEDEYYESLSAVESTPEDDSFLSSPSPPSSRRVSFAQS
ncbi:hypothetical protein BTVI_129857 [Pitangus sulphuratus]|nr:hypothetical protein BTVI_129857 [Pitangus sulphuratus]